MTAPEEWRVIPGQPLYSISDQGRVRSRRRGPERLLRGSLGLNGYRTIGLPDGTGKKQTYIHRLVLLAFVGPCPEGNVVRHLDGDKTNNALANLTYGTSSENNLDTVRHGNQNNIKKTHCPQGHPYDEANTIWRPGSRPWKGPARLCRTCCNARWSYAAQKERKERKAAERAAREAAAA